MRRDDLPRLVQADEIAIRIVGQKPGDRFGRGYAGGCASLVEVVGARGLVDNSPVEATETRAVDENLGVVIEDFKRVLFANILSPRPRSAIKEAQAIRKRRRPVRNHDINMADERLREGVWSLTRDLVPRSGRRWSVEWIARTGPPCSFRTNAMLLG